MTKFVSKGVEFKVGDKVRVVREVTSSHPDGMGEDVQWCNSWVSGMRDYIGRTLVIERIGNTGAYFVGAGLYGFPLSALVNVTVEEAMNGFDAKGNRLNFTDADLKPFQRVKLRSGQIAVVTVNSAGRHGITFPNQTWMGATINGGYNGAASDYDVMEVYAPSTAFWNALTVQEHGSLVWKRDDAKAKAIAQADEALSAARVALAKAEAARAAL